MGLSHWDVKRVVKGEAMPGRPLNATAASLLGFLHEGPMTGWDLVATAEARIGDFWSLTQSQVYRELAAMAEGGLVEAGERGPRDRQPYTITDAGRAAFAGWVDREPGPETIRFPLLLTILFGMHLPIGWPGTSGCATPRATPRRQGTRMAPRPWRSGWHTSGRCSPGSTSSPRPSAATAGPASPSPPRS